MSSDLLSDFIFGEYQSQAGVGVAGDLAAMEQAARDCVSQGATDRELTDKLVPDQRKQKVLITISIFANCNEYFRKWAIGVA